MSLSDIELRILGSLLEKERTTPDGYPLSINALVLACNQKTNREPVSHHPQRDIEDALLGLRDKGLARSFRAAGERVTKHRHRLDEAFDLGPREFALLAVLMLRDRQTPSELRNRTERYLDFPDLESVEACLERMLQYRPPLVQNYSRGPGQSQDRWGHTLGVDPEKLRPRVRQATDQAEAAGPQPSQPSQLERLEREVAALKDRLERVMNHLGLAPEEPPP